jgi:2-polyprenyl-3-methyl-5-hydroxy-6-metoxy-1,4-benzoquinol methylase
MAHSFPCVLCGGPVRRPLFAVGPDRFWRCPTCGLVQMNPLPAPGSAPGEDYVGFDLENYGKFMAEFRIPQYERDLALLRKHAPGGRLLDIGCGMGEFLDVAARGGFRAFGLEPSRTAAEIARRRHPVVRGELGTVEFKAGEFAAATAWSVLEHVPVPADFLRKVHGLLAPGGCLALRVPDVRGLLPALSLTAYRLSFKRVDLPLRVLYQLDWHYKHLYGFDRRTIARLLADNGFEVAAIRSEPSFDYRSLDLRMDYLPVRGLAKAAAKWALGLALLLARLLRRQDELVLIARKKG